MTNIGDAHQQTDKLGNSLATLEEKLDADMLRLFTPEQVCRLSEVTSDQGYNLLHLAVSTNKPKATEYLCKKEPSLVFARNQAGQDTLAILFTDNEFFTQDINLQRKVFLGAINAVEVDLEQIPPEYPLVQQAGKLMNELRAVLKDYGNAFINRKEWWVELVQSHPKLSGILWQISYPLRTRHIKPRQEAFILLLQGLKAAVEEFKLAKFNELSHELAAQAPRGLLRNSALFDNLERKLSNANVPENAEFVRQREAYFQSRKDQETHAQLEKAQKNQAAAEQRAAMIQQRLVAAEQREAEERQSREAAEQREAEERQSREAAEQRMAALEIELAKHKAQSGRQDTDDEEKSSQQSSIPRPQFFSASC